MADLQGGVIMNNKYVTVIILDYSHFVSCLNGDDITRVLFKEIGSKTLRTKEFRINREFRASEKYFAKKIGIGKYAGYDF